MNANELTFGVEIETSIPANSNILVGGYYSAADLSAQGFPRGWKAKSDGSIRPARGHQGCEFVSPILAGADGIASVLATIKKLNEIGARVNASTGVHIHVGWNGDAKALKRLTTLVANFEKAIYASTGTKSRETGSYCRRISNYGSADNPGLMGTRYHVLNLTNLRPGGKNTVEFRAFAGTLNATKIIGYIRMCLGLVERAHKAKRVTNWAAKPVKESSPIHRSGAGQTALTRLFYQLGWVKGRTKHVFGDVTAEGAPTPESIRKELMRLAKQYDQQS